MTDRMNYSALLALCLAVVTAYIQGYLVASGQFLWSLALVAPIVLASYIIARESR